MGGGRPTSLVAALVLLGGGLTGCSSAPAQPSIVALGDSVPFGTGCDCTPYPELSGQDLSPPDAPGVGVTNAAVAGSTSSDVEAQLRSDPAVVDRVRSADIVEIEVGANDAAPTSACGTSAACYQPAVAEVRTHLAAIVDRVHRLTAGHRVLVVLLDYWSVWLGGRYAQEQGPAYVAAATELTDEVNAAIRSTASETSSAYVDLATSFKGPDHTYDETHYLAPDGDHPNAAGQQQIAAETVGVIEAAPH